MGINVMGIRPGRTLWPNPALHEIHILDFAHRQKRMFLPFRVASHFMYVDVLTCMYA